MNEAPSYTTAIAQQASVPYEHVCFFLCSFSPLVRKDWKKVMDNLLKKRLESLHQTADERVDKVARSLIAAFETLGIKAIDVDYGPTYHAVILDVLLENGFQFTARAEADDTEEDEMVGFVIHHHGAEIYEGLDRLSSFADHVDSFCHNDESTNDVYNLNDLLQTTSAAERLPIAG